MSAGMFEGWGQNAANPAAEIGRGIARGMQEQNAKALLAELHARETLAKRLEEIEGDNSYEQQAREQARNYAMQLRMLPPTDKRPKEFLPDKSLEKQLGVTGIEATPAWVRVTLRKRMKDGPQEPAEPPAPADPSAEYANAPQLGAPPNFDELFTAQGAGGQQAAASGAPALPPMPGGQQIGPNAITAAPATPGTLPPPPMPSEYVSTRRAPMDVAAEAAELKRTENAVSLDPDAAGRYDSRALPAIGRQQTAVISLRKLGLQPDGVTPVPDEQLTTAERAKVAHLRAQDELLDAQEALSRARIEYESNRSEIAARQLEIAAGALQVKQQNAQTAASRVAMEGALYGNLLGGGAAGGAGGPQGFLGGVDMGVSDPIESFTEQVLTNQLEFSAIPPKIRPLVSLKIAQRGGVIVPDKLQGKLMQFTEAKEAVDTVQNAIGEYTRSEGTEALWAAYNLNSKIDGLTRIVGRALGEKGVFTDADKADFRKLLSPGIVLTLSNPERATKWIGEVNGILTRVEKQQLQGFYQRVYAKRDQSLDTLRPGDQKNVVAVLDGEQPKPSKPQPVAGQQSSAGSKKVIPAATYDAAVLKFGKAKVDAKYTRGQ